MTVLLRENPLVHLRWYTAHCLMSVPTNLSTEMFPGKIFQELGFWGIPLSGGSFTPQNMTC